MIVGTDSSSMSPGTGVSVSFVLLSMFLSLVRIGHIIAHFQKRGKYLSLLFPNACDKLCLTQVSILKQ